MVQNCPVHDMRRSLMDIHTLFNIHDEIKPIRTSDIKIQAMH